MYKFICLFLAVLQVSMAHGTVVTWNIAPVRISSAGVNASDPQVVNDTHGNALAVWVESNLVRSSYLAYGGSWSTPVTLSKAGAVALSPRLAIDASGNSTAVWVENGIVKASHRPYGGSWGSAVALSDSSSSSLQLAVNGQGEGAAVWTRNGFVESALVSSGTWSTAQVVSPKVGDTPQVAASNQGTIFLVWHSVIASQDAIVYSSTPMSGTWSEPAVISSSSYKSVNPKIAADPFGNAYAIWFRCNYNGLSYYDVVLQGATFGVNEGWNTPVDISTAGLYNPNLLANCIAVDGSGNAVAAWNTALDGALFTYQTAVLPFNGAWSQPLTIASANQYGESISLAVDSLGHAELLYMLYSSPNFKIEVNEMDIYAETLNLTSVQSLSINTINGFPHVAASTDGTNLYAAGVWIYNNGTNTLIYGSTGKGTVFPPPTNLQVVQSSTNYGIFTEYYNTLTWTASTGHPADYLIYRDGIYITEVSSTTLEYVDHNQVQYGTVVYGVAALDTSKDQSSIATVTYH